MQTQGSSTTTLRPLILAGVSGNANGSSEKSLGTKLAVDCAKECPCGVPTIVSIHIYNIFLYIIMY